MKDRVKTIIGVDRARRIRGSFLYLKALPKIKDNGGHVHVLNEHVKEVKSVELNDSHVFCGYYDIAPDNPFNTDEMLVHALPTKPCDTNTRVSLCLADVNTGVIQKCVTSAAWCWQMGSRARWGAKKNGFYYNDVDPAIKGYCCRWFDRNSATSDVVAAKALYDISRDETFGIATDFSRLGRLRPGYGYCNYPDETQGDMAPSSVGLEWVSLIDGSTSMLVSLEELSSMLPESRIGESYINHIAISPNAKKAMFFFIWTTAQFPGWKATLWVYDFALGTVRCLEKDDQVSHYCWIDDEKMIVTGVAAQDGEGFYRIYDSASEGYETIRSESLARDGHPSISRVRRGFYSDTYPDEDYMQSFFFYDMERGCIPIAKLLHDPRMYGERRCDLHPHYFRSSETVALDTTCRGGKRSVALIKMGDAHES